jgi:hypothetical protein
VFNLTLDAGSGTTAGDSSGNGNNGTLVNGPTWTTGTTFGAVTFDGSNDAIEVPASATINSVTTSVTVATWVYRNAAQSSWVSVLSRQLGTGGAEQYYLGFNANQYRWVVNTAAGYSNLGLGGAAPVGQWVHLVGTYDGTMVRLYVNGAEAFATAHTGSFVTDTAGVTIGGAHNDGTE